MKKLIWAGIALGVVAFVAGNTGHVALSLGTGVLSFIAGFITILELAS